MLSSIALTITATCLATLLALGSATPTLSVWPTDRIPQFLGIDDWIRHKQPQRWQRNCTTTRMRVRKDFDTMAKEERRAYTSAIQCLRNLPSNLNQTLYPAATDRYMDYAVVHTKQAKYVHVNGYFLTWHRYFLHLFEEDLRHTCGYRGAFPYWNWPATADNLTGSPIFNGDAYSMSGDGAPTTNDPIVLSPGLSLPHGTGGGCIQSGPFTNWTTTMADIPITVILQNLPLPATAFVRNTTCLTRDLNPYAAQTYTNTTAVSLAVQAPILSSLSLQINGVLGGGSLGIHSGAHFTIGSPGSSLFVSPQDPIWWPLHTMLDRVYSSWQSQHPDLANATDGTMTAFNNPPSDNVTLDSVVPGFDYFNTRGDLAIGELISTTSGPFCYRYDYDI